MTTVEYLKDPESPVPDKTKPDQELSIFSYDEAVSLTSTGKFHYYLQVVCILSFCAQLMEFMVLSQFLNQVATDLQASVTEQGYLVSVAFLGAVVSSHTVGFFADTWGRVKVIKTSLAVSIITSVISAFSTTIWMLIALRFLNGMSSTGIQGCVINLIGEFHSNKTRLKYTALILIAVALATLLGPSSAIVLLSLKLNLILFEIKFDSWRLMLFVNCTISALALVGWLFLTESPKFLFNQGRRMESFKVLRKMFSTNTGKGGSEYPVHCIEMEITGDCSLSNVSGLVEGLKLMWNQTVPVFHKTRILHTINFSVLIFTIYGISQGLVMWFPTIINELRPKSGSGYTTCEVMELAEYNSTTMNATDNGSDDPPDVGLFQTLIWTGILYTIKCIFFSLVVDFVGRKKLAFFWLLCGSLGSLSLYWVSPYTLTIILMTLTLDIDISYSVVSTFAVEYYPTHVNAMAMCLLTTVARLGSFAGSNIVGAMLFSHCNLLYFGVSAVLGVLGVLVIFLPSTLKAQKNSAFY